MARKLGFALLLIIFAATFVRLGIWQLDRAHLVQQISKPVADKVEVAIESLIKPRISIPDDAKGRLVSAYGRYERILQAPNQSTENAGVRKNWQVGILKLSNGAGLLVVRGIGEVAPPNENNVPEPPVRVHWDNAFARKVGVPAAYDFGPERICWMSHMLTDWQGDDGFLRRLRIEVRRHNCVGDIVWCRGKVVDKRIVDGQAVVDCEVWAENQTGELSVKGIAEIELPRA